MLIPLIQDGRQTPAACLRPSVHQATIQMLVERSHTSVMCMASLPLKFSLSVSVTLDVDIDRGGHSFVRLLLLSTLDHRPRTQPDETQTSNAV